MVLAAGFIVIALGIGGLILSHWLDVERNATANSWWVSTFQALGVGFVVGGIVDVLVISGLDAVNRAEEDKREDFNKRAREILDSPPVYISDEGRVWDSSQKLAALDLIAQAKDLLDKDLAAQLRTVVLGF